MEKEASRLTGLVEAAEACTLDVDIACQTLEINLSMRFSQWEERSLVIDQLEVKIQEREALSQGKDEVIERMT